LKAAEVAPILFNTLTFISAHLGRDSEVTEAMLARLRDFRRMTLDNSAAQEVALEDEEKFLRCYPEDSACALSRSSQRGDRHRTGY
jgi:LytS/YehU family sensor histidine kinase